MSVTGKISQDPEATSLEESDLAGIQGGVNKKFPGELMQPRDATLGSQTSWVIDEDNMASDSATKVPTQQSVKAYSDNTKLAKASNLSDLANADTALTNLGGGSKGIAIFKDTTSDAVLTELGAGTTGKAMLAAGTQLDGRTTLGLNHIKFVTDSEYGTVDLTGAASSQTAVAAAVADANTNGYDLYWPAGTYLTTATIPNLHDVRHIGPGVIKRGSDTFRVDQKSGTNIIYLDTAGDDSNDGLTSSQPLATTQAAFDLLAKYPMPLAGTWKIVMAAGTWTEGAVMAEGVTSRENIEIVGPEVTRAVPTAIVDGTGAAKNTGFSFPSFSKIYMQDIRIQDFTQNDFAYGILHVDHSQLYCNNVDVIRNTYGIGTRRHTRLRYRYGRAVSNTRGILAIDFALITIGYAASTTPTISTGGTFLETDGSLIRDNDFGVYATENTQGHVDFSRIFNNSDTGIFMAYGTRLNIPSCDIFQNGVGVEHATGAWSVNLGSSTFTSNTTDIINGGYAGRVDSEFGKIANIGQTAFLGADTTSTTAPATTGSYQKHIDAFATLPGDGLKAGKGILKVIVAGDVNKTGAASHLVGFRLYAGGDYIATGSLSSSEAAVGSFVIEFRVFATGASAQKYVCDVRAGDSRASRISETFIGTRAVDLSSNQDLHIYTFRDDAGDTFTIETVSAEIYGNTD